MMLVRLDDTWSVEIAWAGVALENDVSGDHHVVAAFDGGAVVAIFDGLGHGEEAAIAAHAAGAIVEEHAGEPVDLLIQRCHEGVRGTRGVVMSVVSFSTRDATLSWCGVGNVDVSLFRADSSAQPGVEALLLRGGVVGFQIPQVRVVSLPISHGDKLVMATDGIRSGFEVDVEVREDPADTAAAILAGHGRGSDDALVVVVCFLESRT